MKPRIVLQALAAAISIFLGLPKEGAIAAPEWFTSATVFLRAIGPDGNDIFKSSDSIGSSSVSSISQTFDLGGGGSVSVSVGASTGGTVSSANIDISWTQGLQQITLIPIVTSRVQVFDFTLVNEVPEMLVEVHQIPGSISYSLLPNDSGIISYHDSAGSQLDNGLSPGLNIVASSADNVGPGTFSFDVPFGSAGPSRTVQVSQEVTMSFPLTIAPRTASAPAAFAALSAADAGTGSFHYDGAIDFPAAIGVDVGAVPEPTSLLIWLLLAGIGWLVNPRIRASC